MRDSIENLLEVKENTAYIFVSNSVNQSCVEENNAVKVDFFSGSPIVQLKALYWVLTEER